LELIPLFKEIIRVKSETPEDGGLLDFVTEYLQDFIPVRLDKNGVKNLFIYKNTKNSAKVNISVLQDMLMLFLPVKGGMLTLTVLLRKMDTSTDVEHRT
jgi:hypothetical protein